MKKLERQIDLNISGLRIRETEGDSKSRTIIGHAVVFGVRSVNLTPWSSYREVFEVMEPGSITQELLNRSDVVLTAFHDFTAILGRWRQGKGTLKLSLDDKGLLIECELAETERANELLSAIERGDINGMSFAFTCDEEDSENGVSYEHVVAEDHDGKEVWIRHIKTVTALYDVTIAGHPAYEQTDIAQREAIDAMLDEKIGKREDEKKDDSEKKEDDNNQEPDDNAGDQNTDTDADEAEKKAEEERQAEAERERQERELMAEREHRRAIRRHITENIESFNY